MAVNLLCVFLLTVFLPVLRVITWLTMRLLAATFSVVLTFMWRVALASFVLAVGFICTTPSFSVLHVSRRYILIARSAEYQPHSDESHPVKCRPLGLCSPSSLLSWENITCYLWLKRCSRTAFQLPDCDWNAALVQHFNFQTNTSRCCMGHQAIVV